jgi:hypothetical protein
MVRGHSIRTCHPAKLQALIKATGGVNREIQHVSCPLIYWAAARLSVFLKRVGDTRISTCPLARDT